MSHLDIVNKLQGDKPQQEEKASTNPAQLEPNLLNYLISFCEAKMLAVMCGTNREWNSFIHETYGLNFPFLESQIATLLFRNPQYFDQTAHSNKSDLISNLKTFSSMALYLWASKSQKFAWFVLQHPELHLKLGSYDQNAIDNFNFSINIQTFATNLTPIPGNITGEYLFNLAEKFSGVVKQKIISEMGERLSDAQREKLTPTQTNLLHEPLFVA